MRVRSVSQPVPDAAENQDAAFVVGDLVGVLDGVSVLDGMATGCVHGPTWYVQQLVVRLSEAHSQSLVVGLAELLAAAIDAVRDDHAGQCDLSHPGTPAASVGLLKACGDRAEYLLLSDITLIIDRGDEPQLITDERFGQAVAELRRAAFAGAPILGSPDQQQRLRTITHQRQQLANRPNGYWIAAANPDAAYHAVTGTFPLTGDHPVKAAALLTDGAADAVDRYNLLTWRSLLDLIQCDGPEELIRRVRAAENADHTGQSQPRHKRHDDATVALCQFQDIQP